MTPKSVMTCADEQRLDLEVIEGSLPRDMLGVGYVIGAIPRGEDPLFSGDGRVWRFDCEDAAGSLPMLSRTVRTWDQQLDEANPGAFTTTGYARFSSELGYRTFANTAFVPLIDGRLVITGDAGRPWEIDPTTLEAITPVGYYAEWLWSAPHEVNPLMMSTAHPGYDPSTGEMFIAEQQLVVDDLKTMEGLYENDVHITVWGGSGGLQRWRVRGMHITMCVHQVALTEHHVVLIDTNFLVEFKQGVDPEIFEAAPGPAQVYLIRRADLIPANRARGVEAVHVELPIGVVHGVADFLEVDGLVTLHVGGPGATDASEWIRPSDVTWHEGAPIDPDLMGFLPASGDVNPLGRFAIDPASGEIVEAHVVKDLERFWSVGLYARNESTLERWRRPDSLWWAGGGYDPATLVERVVALYADHDQRTVPVEELSTRPKAGRLMRLDTRALEVVDEFVMPLGRAITSPVFIPRRGGAAEDDGYILLVVNADSGDEIWLFDAADLAQGPVCRLGHPELVMPWTIHTTWMPRVGARRSRYAVDPVRDEALTAKVYPQKMAQMMKAWTRR